MMITILFQNHMNKVKVQLTNTLIDLATHFNFLSNYYYMDTWCYATTTMEATIWQTITG